MTGFALQIDLREYEKPVIAADEVARWREQAS